MNSLEIRNRKIIDAVIRKEQAVCPGGNRADRNLRILSDGRYSSANTACRDGWNGREGWLQIHPGQKRRNKNGPVQ